MVGRRRGEPDRPRRRGGERPRRRPLEIPRGPGVPRPPGAPAHGSRRIGPAPLLPDRRADRAAGGRRRGGPAGAPSHFLVSGGGSGRDGPGGGGRLVLVGARRGYPEGDVEAVLRSLSVDPGACLSGFYTRCFYPSQMPAWRRFRAGLQAAYLREMGGGVLREGLSYLANARLSGGTLPPCPVSIVHGEKDVVAPLAEAEGAARESGNATFHPLPGAAHAPFLAEGFLAAAADG